VEKLIKTKAEENSKDGGKILTAAVYESVKGPGFALICLNLSVAGGEANSMRAARAFKDGGKSQDCEGGSGMALLGRKFLATKLADKYGKMGVVIPEEYEITLKANNNIGIFHKDNELFLIITEEFEENRRRISITDGQRIEWYCKNGLLRPGFDPFESDEREEVIDKLLQGVLRQGF
jgi:hypothetical protein